MRFRDVLRFALNYLFAGVGVLIANAMTGGNGHQLIPPILAATGTVLAAVREDRESHK